MDGKTYGIGILSLTAVVLLVGNYFAAPPAAAQVTVRDREFQVVTAPLQAGSDALYILDNRNGVLAVFTYDMGARMARPRAVRQVSDAFAVPIR